MKIRLPLIILAIGIVFLFVRLLFLQRFGIAIDADEAIVGLMGRHILGGQHTAFYYGQDYMGSLEAYLAAAVFMLLGATPLALKLVPLLVSVVFLAVTVALAMRIYGRKAGALTGLLLASPPFFFVNWGLKARGGYIETLLFGSTLLFLAHKLLALESRPTPAPVELTGAWRKAVRVTNGLLVILVILILYIVMSGGTVIRAGGLRISLTSVGNPLRVTAALFILKGMLILPRIGLRHIWNAPYARLVGLLGFVAGLSWWTNQLIVFYLLPIGIVLLARERKRVLASDYQFCYGGIALLSAALGALPTVIHQLTGPGKQAVFYSPVGLSEWLLRLRHYFSQGMPVILGLRGAWSWRNPDTYASIAILGLHVLAVGFLIYRLIERRRMESGLTKGIDGMGSEEILLLSLILYPPVFAASSVGWFISEPRYLLPLYSVLPVMMAGFLAAVWKRTRLLCVVMVVLLMGYPVYDLVRTDPVTLQPWVANRRLPISFEPLIAFLRDRGVTHAYADYWVAYRLTFESGETIVTTVYPPGLDRYPDYTAQVAQHPSPAYIKMNSEWGFPALLAGLGIETYSVEALGNVVVYYDLDLPRREPATGMLEPDGWEVSTTHNPDAATYAVDGNRDTRWTSGHPQQAGMAYEVQLGAPAMIGGLLLSAGDSPHDYPRGLAIRATLDGHDWQTLVHYDDMTQAMLSYMVVEHPVSFPGRDLYFEFSPLHARAIRIEALRDDDNQWWSIARLEVFRASMAPTTETDSR